MTISTDRKPRLEEVLKTLHEQGSVNFNGTIILGQMIGNLNTGGFLEPSNRYSGSVLITREQQGYGFRFADESEIVNISTDKRWLLCRGSSLHYATALRRELRSTPHLVLNTDEIDQAHHFAILYYNRNHQ